MRNLDAVNNLTNFVVNVVNNAQLIEKPFHRIFFDQFFPADVYQQIIEAMPVKSDYRPMSGRSKDYGAGPGGPSRVKIDLFPEYIRFLPQQKRVVWDTVGRVLCSGKLQTAFVKRLAPALKQRFGEEYADVGLFPMPVLTRDIAGYKIAPHTDTLWKAITVLIYLPPDASTAYVGTIIHEHAADGSLKRAGAARFLPNSGFAFVVGKESWHSVDLLRPEIKTRDLIILQYFVDRGLLRVFRNRGKRLGNMLLNAWRHLVG